MIRLGINSRSSTEGCFSTTKDRNKMVIREQFVFRALRIILIWCRDVVRSYQIQSKAIIDSFTVAPDERLKNKRNRTKLRMVKTIRLLRRLGFE